MQKLESTTERKPYKSLYAALAIAARGLHDFREELHIPAAICVIESMGNPWFCKCDSLYKGNTREITEMFSVDITADVLRRLTVKGGEHAGKIAKFNFDVEWFLAHRYTQFPANTSIAEKVFMSCTVGFAGKPAFELHSSMPYAERQMLFQQFVKDPEFQLTTLLHDLNKVKAFQPELTRSAVAILRERKGRDKALEYADRVISLAQELQRIHNPLRLVASSTSDNNA